VRVVFASDIHGSEQCFRKFLNSAAVYRADVLILGGDITGKVLVPVVEKAGGWVTHVGGREVTAETEAERRELERLIRISGQYTISVTADEKAVLDTDPVARSDAFRTAMRRTVEDWLALATERMEPRGIPVIMMPGNDDWTDVSGVLDAADYVVNGEDRLIDLPEGYQLLSYGFSNRTPWNSPRELDDDVLGERLRRLIESAGGDMERMIFNFHVPPHGSSLDLAPALSADFKPKQQGGQVEMANVGSFAVRALIEEAQPLVGLHGHIHESKSVQQFGRTVCVNPGSEYGTGMLKVALLDLRKSRVKSWQLITG
jgi:Icc-related predicted phosphoesterase